MNSLKEIIPEKFDNLNVLDSHFIQLINSLSGIRIISNLGNQQIDKEHFIDKCMRTILEHLEVETASLYLLEDQSLNCVASLNWDQLLEDKSSLNNKKVSYLLSEGIIGDTATKQQLIHIRNCKTAEEDLIRYKSNDTNVGSLLCSPVSVNNAVMGVLELTHPDVEHFKTWQEHSIVIYSDLIGMLLNNIQLLSNMQSAINSKTEELRHNLEESEKLRIRYEEMSVIDHLTKLYNRRYLFTEVASSLSRAKRYSQKFSLLLMDLDKFKNINDVFGHECGDEVLIGISDILSEFTRAGDTLARIGGEEFVLALPETHREGALKLAERIRKTVDEHNWECDGKSMDVRISIGIATLEDCGEDKIHEEDIQVSDLLRKADLALYHVKRHGRNNVKCYSDLPKN